MPDQHSTHPPTHLARQILLHVGKLLVVGVLLLQVSKLVHVTVRKKVHCLCIALHGGRAGGQPASSSGSGGSSSGVTGSGSIRVGVGGGGPTYLVNQLLMLLDTEAAHNNIEMPLIVQHSLCGSTMSAGAVICHPL